MNWPSEEETKTDSFAAPSNGEPRKRFRDNDENQNRPRFPRNQDGKPHIIRPSLAGGLLTYKQFMEMQHEQIPPQEAQQIYDDYKTKYERKHLEIFFSEHNNEHWFIEKYDPIFSQKWQEERYLDAKVSHTAFIELSKHNGFSGLRLKIQESPVEKISGPPYFGFDPNSMTLFLKNIPVNISRWDVLNVVKTSPGFVSLSMSEPLKTQGFSRFAWVLYDTEDHCNESLELLTGRVVTPDFKLSPVKSQSVSRKELRLQPPQHPSCIELDWKQSSRLITFIDREKGINENQLLITEEMFATLSEEEKEMQLDLQLLYLRRVHAFCYYCQEEYEDERMLAAKCGPAHIRTTYDEAAARPAEFDQKIEERILRKNPVKKYDKDNDPELQKMIKEFETKNTTEEEEKKVRCNLCKKLFRSNEFMKKHLQTKHQEDYQLVVKERVKAITLENYLADPDKLQNQIQFAGDRFRGRGRGDRGDRGDRGEHRERSDGADREVNFPRKRPVPDEPYEDLDDPAKHPKGRRAIVDYSDI
ncbi:SRRT_2 [Blepharisma stoltei]|uniref:C2H2-type domain-containing protein n=1 Tax=Blepharisma stoltei TaxID=1481888 RepID=A0AAU9K6B7_9CILI|nr:unnamed protein product [Blepharisma stoltei]